MNDNRLSKRPVGRAKVVLSMADAQALYDHTGTMPHAPGSWSNNVREAVNNAMLVVALEKMDVQKDSGGIGHSYRAKEAVPSTPQADALTSASIPRTRLSAVEYIQGDAYLWGIGELDANVVLANVAEHLGLAE